MFATPTLVAHKELSWHKNFGLVAYHLSSFDDKAVAAYRASAEGAAEWRRGFRDLMVQHWTAYVDAGPDDPQVSSMRNIIRGHGVR